MKEKNELSYRDLKMVCNQNMFKFETTEELEAVTDGIGQERGIKALQFGINVDVKGYNIYMEGPNGVGKTMYAKNYLDSIAPKKKVPCDWCYIYNFQNPNEPIAVSLPAGQGKEFKESMDGFIKEVESSCSITDLQQPICLSNSTHCLSIYITCIIAITYTCPNFICSYDSSNIS